MGVLSANGGFPLGNRDSELTASSHLQMDGWNTTVVSFWGPAYFQVRTVTFREGKDSFKKKPKC